MAKKTLGEFEPADFPEFKENQLTRDGTPTKLDLLHEYVKLRGSIAEGIDKINESRDTVAMCKDQVREAEAKTQAAQAKTVELSKQLSAANGLTVRVDSLEAEVSQLEESNIKMSADLLDERTKTKEALERLGWAETERDAACKEGDGLDLRVQELVEEKSKRVPVATMIMVAIVVFIVAYLLGKFVI